GSGPSQVLDQLRQPDRVGEAKALVGGPLVLRRKVGGGAPVPGDGRPRGPRGEPPVPARIGKAGAARREPGGGDRGGGPSDRAGEAIRPRSAGIASPGGLGGGARSPRADP